jgi:putative membrane protein (TIGR04086 family)
MEMAKGKSNSIIKMIGTLLVMYVITGAALLMLAVLLYKFQLSEQVVSIGIMVIYVIAGLLGGLIMGKRMGRRRFLWGILMGAVYFLVLLAGSILLNKGVTSDVIHMGTTLVMCMASGMIGGMLS